MHADCCCDTSDAVCPCCISGSWRDGNWTQTVDEVVTVEIERIEYGDELQFVGTGDDQWHFDPPLETLWVGLNNFAHSDSCTHQDDHDHVISEDPIVTQLKLLLWDFGSAPANDPVSSILSVESDEELGCRWKNTLTTGNDAFPIEIIWYGAWHATPFDCLATENLGVPASISSHAAWGFDWSELTCTVNPTGTGP